MSLRELSDTRESLFTLRTNLRPRAMSGEIYFKEVEAAGGQTSVPLKNLEFFRRLNAAQCDRLFKSSSRKSLSLSALIKFALTLQQRVWS